MALPTNGLIYNLDASLLTGADATSLSTVPNQGGTGADATGGTNKPTLSIDTAGVKRVKGNASGGLALSFPSMDVGEVTIFMVMRREDALTTNKVVLGMGTYPAPGILDQAGTVAATGLGLNTWNSGLRSDTEDALYVMRASRSGSVVLGDGVAMYKNGMMSFRSRDTNGAQWPTGATTTGFLGNANDGIGLGFIGSWRRFVMYNRALSDAEIAQISIELASACGVRLQTARQNLVFKADSQTVGFTGGGVFINYYDTILLGQTVPFRAYNFGIVGQFMVAAHARPEGRPAALYDPAMERNVLVLWGGTNDGNGNPNDVAGPFAAFKAEALEARAAGFQVIVIPALPRGAVAAYETWRVAFNALIEGDSSFYDTLLRQTDLPEIFAAGAQNNLRLYQADKGHLTERGYQIVGRAVNGLLARLGRLSSLDVARVAAALLPAIGTPQQAGVAVALPDNVATSTQVLAAKASADAATEAANAAKTSANAATQAVQGIVIPNPDLSPITAKLDTVAIKVTRTLGLAQENAVTEPVFSNDSLKQLLSATIYVYDSAAHAQTNNKSTGLVAKYLTTNTYSAGVLIDSSTIEVS